MSVGRGDSETVKKEWLTPAEFGLLLLPPASDDTVRRMIEAGKIFAVKTLSNRNYIHRDELLRLTDKIQIAGGCKT